MKKINRLPFELVLVIAVIAANIYVVFSPANSVMNWYTTDDAFYYYKTAQNATEGLGLSFDGFGLSSGFHPLWMLICLPVFALARFDLILPLRIIIFISILLAAASSVVFYRLLNRIISNPAAMLISLFWAFEPRVQATVTQLGMESGINALFILLLLYHTYLYQNEFGKDKDDYRRLIKIGVIAILTILSRLDNVYLVMMVGFWLVFRKPDIRKLLLIDLLIIATSVFFSFFLKVGFEYKYYPFVDASSIMVITALVIKIPLFFFLGLYGRNKAGNIRNDLLRITAAVSLGSILTFAIMMGLSHSHLFGSFPRSVVLYDWVICLFSVLVLRWIFSYAGKQTGLLPVYEGDHILRQNWKRWLFLGLSVFGPVVVGMIIYMGIYKLYFGTFTPVSGQVKHWWGTIITVYGRPVVSYLEYFGIPPVPDRGPWSLALGTLVICAKDTLTALGMNPKDSTLYNNAFMAYSLAFGGLLLTMLVFWWKKIIEVTKNVPVWPLFAGCMAQIINYSGTNYVNSRGWYWIAEIILTVLILSFLVEAFFDFLVRRFHANQRFLRMVVIILGMLMIIDFDSTLLQQIPPVIPPENEKAYLGGIEDLENQTEPGAVIGSTGGGVIGYFIKGRTIVNMDGLMNSVEYFELMQAHKSYLYFKKIGLDYVYANSAMIDQSEPYIWMVKDQVTPIGNFSGSTLYRYTPVP